MEWPGGVTRGHRRLHLRQGVNPGAACCSYLTLLLVAMLMALTMGNRSYTHVRFVPGERQERWRRGLLAPRVEYDEWTPLGQGDPLKNDPTYAYVPPMLERVRYWIEAAPPPSAITASTSNPSPPPAPFPSPPPQQTVGPMHLRRKPSQPSQTDVRPFSQTLFQPPPARTPSPPSILMETSTSRVTLSQVTTAPTLPQTTTPPPTSLTTDPLFAHYKQPAHPLQGPMYLIIQGHSKVKNYGSVGRPTLVRRKTGSDLSR